MPVSVSIFPKASRIVGERSMKLTAQGLAAHKPPVKADYILHDEQIKGFGLRVRGDRRTWIFQYSIGTGKAKITRRIKIGDYPALPPAKARAEAEDLHAKVHTHGDPAAEKRKNRVEAGNTFEKLAQSYLEFQRAELRRNSLRELRRHLEVNAKPLHALPLTQIDRDVIARRLDAVAKASGSVTSNRTRATLSAMYAWGMREGRAAENPVLHTNKRNEKSRDRVLSDAELCTIWRALGNDDYGDIIRLLILTAQRANEIAGLSWPEIDFERGVISLPGSRVKNGRAHEIPLARTTRAILQARLRTEDRTLLFGLREGRPYNGWHVSKIRLDRKIAEATGAPLEAWVVHDIRRSVATRMADIGIAPHIIESLLNHVSGHKGGIAGIYNRALYSAEKAQALSRWDEHISALVESRPAKVTALRA